MEPIHEDSALARIARRAGELLATAGHPRPFFEWLRWPSCHSQPVAGRARPRERIATPSSPWVSLNGSAPGVRRRHRDDVVIRAV